MKTLKNRHVSERTDRHPRLREGKHKEKKEASKIGQQVKVPGAKPDRTQEYKERTDFCKLSSVLHPRVHMCSAHT